MKYSQEPEDKKRYTAEADQLYSRFARVYELAVQVFPVWRWWISHVLPNVQGPRVLEVSFGTGYLLGQYGRDIDVFGVELNREMIGVARKQVHNRPVYLQQADAAHLPFQSGTFDTIVNTMAFTAYPDGMRTMDEFSRVLGDKGRLVMVDINYPLDGNRIGTFLARMWMRLGDILRDMTPLFEESGFAYVDKEIGGWGSVHLYVAKRVT
jgi:ubiquinone/menaquinone biosynthesis C-methylase UbiE